LTQTQNEYRQRVREFVKWSKVVVVVVVMTLLAVLVLENARMPTSVMLIAWPWGTSAAMVMSVSFLSGVIVTLLVLFLGRRSRK
jgi:uncharacterized integral membrane protein